MADPPERKILNEADHISHSVADLHVRENNAVHCVANLQVMEM